MRLIWIAFALLAIEGGLTGVIASFWPILVGNLGRSIGIDNLDLWLITRAASLLVGLSLLIALKRRLNWRTIFWICVAGILVGSGLTTWAGSAWLQFAGQNLTTLFAAPLFTGLLFYVKNQISPAFAPVVIGWLVAASSVGSDLVSRVRGEAFSETVNAILIFVLIVLFIATIELMNWLQEGKKKKRSPDTLEAPAFLPEEPEASVRLEAQGHIQKGL